MDAQTGVGEGASVALRQQIEQTQGELGAKIGALEDEVRAVTTHAKEFLHERVEAVKDVVDVRRHVARYPFVSVAIALGAGLFIARRRKGGSARRMSDTQAGWVRQVVAPQVASLQTMLAGRALALIGDLVSQRIFYPQSGRAKTPPDSRL